MITKKMPGAVTPGKRNTRLPQFTKTNPGRNPKIEFDRLLPHDKEAEIAVLESLVAAEMHADPTQLKKVKKIISPGDFYKRGGSRVFETMLKFRAAGRGFTLATLEDSFQSDPDAEKFSAMFDSFRPVTGQVATHFAKIILENSIRRALIHATFTANTQLFDPAFSVFEIIGKLQTAINRAKSRLRHARR